MSNTVRSVQTMLKKKELILQNTNSRYGNLSAKYFQFLFPLSYQLHNILGKQEGDIAIRLQRIIRKLIERTSQRMLITRDALPTVSHPGPD